MDWEAGNKKRTTGKMALDINRNVISRNKQEPYFSWTSYFTMAEKLTAVTEEAVRGLQL